tara:strand:- start:1550 stop:1699 length:150 start_codon:yes stop_codon:yes gene_type:complete
MAEAKKKAAPKAAPKKAAKKPAEKAAEKAGMSWDAMSPKQRREYEAQGK